MISRKENNRAKYAATENQREFVAGNAAIIFRMFFPILRIANRFCVYPGLPSRDASLYMYINMGPNRYIAYRRFLVDSKSDRYCEYMKYDRFKCFRIFASHCTSKRYPRASLHLPLYTVAEFPVSRRLQERQKRPM